MALRALQGPTGGGSPVGGGGTSSPSTIPRWTGPSTLGDSVITQSGNNIGVGEPSPAGRLQVQGLSGNNTITAIGSTTTGQSYGIFVQAGTNASDRSFGVYNTSLSPYLFVRGDGNVGFGTASPLWKNHTVGAGLLLSGTAFNLAAVNQDQTTYRGVSLGYDTSGQIGVIASTGASSSLAFWTNNAGTWGERARIDSAGRLLVGTSTAPNSANVRSVLASSVSVYAGIQNTGSNVGCAFGVGSANFELYTSTLAYGSESYVARMAVSSAGTAAQSQVAIGTSSFTSGRALTTVADLDVFGVRVGRGGDGSQTSNTALGRSVLGAITTGDSCTGVGALALQSATGSRNTGLGYASLAQLSSGVDNSALGSSAAGNNTGSRNTAIGSRALQGVAGTSTGSDNVCIGERAGDSITTGASNIVIGSNADLAAATDSNKLVIGDATNYVATNGGATTYYATAGALAGYIIVRLNGTDVKLPVYAL